MNVKMMLLAPAASLLALPAFAQPAPAPEPPQAPEAPQEPEAPKAPEAPTPPSPQA
ncbi:hypothetical protein [Sandarakinorhabdus sp.]|uniref:hypothetical protein n=1 Tax=Sandarakinorhabdus sp. TaxID=1916663 RepID=UPI003F720F68